MKIEKINHISIAVRQLEKARQIFEDVLGLELDAMEGYADPREKRNVVRYNVGGVVIELMEPIGEGEVSRFIEKRGEGVYVISFKVDDVENALAELKGKGYKLIDNEARVSPLNNRYAFINHPKELCGVLAELLDNKG